MNRLLLSIFAPAFGVGAVAAAYAAQGDPAAPATPARSCFRAADVDGWTPRGRDEVDVRVGPRRQYRLTLAGSCPDIDWSIGIAIRTRGGSSWICSGRAADAEIFVPSPTGRQSCLVTGVRQLSEAEIEAARHAHH